MVPLAAGVGLFLAFWSWVGFEAIPNYAEESKDPKHIVPRATLISVVGLGIGYVITSLAFVSAFPEDELIKTAGDADNPPFFLAMEQYGNVFFKDLMQVLILTGSFACAMAFHNVAMRYFYAMGREGDPAQVARQDAPEVQVAVRREHHADRDRARARAGLGHRLRLRASRTRPTPPTSASTR